MWAGSMRTARDRRSPCVVTRMGVRVEQWTAHQEMGVGGSGAPVVGGRTGRAWRKFMGVVGGRLSVVGRRWKLWCCALLLPHAEDRQRTTDPSSIKGGTETGLLLGGEDGTGLFPETGAGWEWDDVGR